MSEPEKQEEQPEVWGPTKPPRLLSIGYRYDRARGMRYRLDKRRTKIAPLPGNKFERRRMRRGFSRYYRVVGMGLGHAILEKTIQVDVKLENERHIKATVRENTENSHEARRLYEKDRKWRSEQRKKATAEDHAKRTAMGESLRPLGVQLSRSERKAQAKAVRKQFADYLQNQQLAERMAAAIGVPSTSSLSEPTTPASPET